MSGITDRGSKTFYVSKLIDENDPADMMELMALYASFDADIMEEEYNLHKAKAFSRKIKKLTLVRTLVAPVELLAILVVMPFDFTMDRIRLQKNMIRFLLGKIDVEEYLGHLKELS